MKQFQQGMNLPVNAKVAMAKDTKSPKPPVPAFPARAAAIADTTPLPQPVNQALKPFTNHVNLVVKKPARPEPPKKIPVVAEVRQQMNAAQKPVTILMPIVTMMKLPVQMSIIS